MLKEMLKNALILFGITLVAGLLLGGVYELTKKPREKQKELAKTNSYKEVLSDAYDFEELKVDKEKLSAILEAYDITEKNVLIDACVKAYDNDKKVIGYIVSATSKEGYGGNISISVGFDMSGAVTGVSILSISETAGLGMEAKNESFLSQYKSSEDGLYEVNKAQGSEGINIDALSGATITSKAMTKGVNAAKITAAYLLGKGGTDAGEGGDSNE